MTFVIVMGFHQIIVVMNDVKTAYIHTYNESFSHVRTLQENLNNMVTWYPGNLQTTDQISGKPYISTCISTMDFKLVTKILHTKRKKQNTKSSVTWRSVHITDRNAKNRFLVCKIYLLSCDHDNKAINFLLFYADVHLCQFTCTICN